MLTTVQIHKRRERYMSLQSEITAHVTAVYKGKNCWKVELPMLLDKVGREHATRNKSVSLATLKARRQIMTHFFKELFELGYKLPSIYSFREKHAKVLFCKWEMDGLSASTLQ